LVAHITPQSVEEAAECLASSAAQGRIVTPWGGGMHQHLGRAPHPESLELRMGALSRVLEYEPADLMVMVEAGARLADLQARLREHGQWLPWDPPGAARATVGGLLAAARSGPLRLAYGTPRDWLLGMRVVLGDGRVVKSGGRVVKNVAGYDSHKLQIGALGTLGLIAAATFKVAPLPEVDQSMVRPCASMAEALQLAEDLRARPYAPASLVALAGPGAAQLLPAAPGGALLLARYCGVAGAVARHLALAQGLGAQPLAGAAQIWDRVANLATPDGDARLIIRMGVRPSALGAACALLAHSAPGDHTVAAYPGVGLIVAAWPAGAPDADALSGMLATLRAGLAEHAGYLVVESAPDPLRATLDLWGPPPPTLAIMQQLKQRWDPAGILNPGRYLDGI
jgi:glycolate oxidase FAD binding subunit